MSAGDVGEQQQRGRHGPAADELLADVRKEQQGRHGGEERHQPQRQVLLAEDDCGDLRGPQPADRGRLAVGVDVQQLSEGASHDVMGEGHLVGEERAVEGVLPQPQYEPEQHSQDRNTPRPDPAHTAAGGRRGAVSGQPRAGRLRRY